MEVTGGFLLLMAWLNYTDTQGLLPLVLCAAAAHELGHLLMITALSGHVRLLRLSAAGAELRLDAGLSYMGEMLCALAGPAVNLLLAWLTAQAGTRRAFLFAGINLALGCFNLLPVSALDGGRSVCCAAAMLLEPDQVQRLRRGMDLTVTGLAAVVGAAVFCRTGNLTALIAAAWLLAVGRGGEEKGVAKRRASG